MNKKELNRNTNERKNTMETTEERRKRITKETMLKCFKLKHEERIKKYGYDKDEEQYKKIISK